MWSNEGGVREGKRHNSHSGICSSHFHSVTMVSGFLYLVSILQDSPTSSVPTDPTLLSCRRGSGVGIRLGAAAKSSLSPTATMSKSLG